IDVDYASHSAQVEMIRDEVLEVLAGLEPSEGDVPLFSTVTGEWVTGAMMTAEYWYQNLRQTVQFDRAVRALLAAGFTTFIGSSPDPLGLAGIHETAEAENVPVATIGSLRRGEGGWDRFVRSVAEAYVQGVPLDWEGFFAGCGGRRVDLPTYAFQRQRYWLA